MDHDIREQRRIPFSPNVFDSHEFLSDKNDFGFIKNDTKKSCESRSWWLALTLIEVQNNKKISTWIILVYSENASFESSVAVIRSYSDLL